MKIQGLLTFLVLVSLTACGTFQIGIEYTPPAEPTQELLPSGTPVTPTQELLPSGTLVVQTATSSPLPPVVSPTPALPTPTPIVPQATSGPQMVQIFLVAVDDNGQSGALVGCGDSLVPVQVEIQPSQGVLRASMEALLALKQQFYGQSGLYNALYQSDLHLDGLSLAAGKATIYLSGSLTLGGMCDNPRVAGQLESTARQFPTVTDVSIFINGKPLADVLSLK